MESKQLALPVQPGERIKVIDTIRGFALLGILMVNMIYFKAPNWFIEPTPSQFSTMSSQIGAWIIQSLFTSKFYAIFSFLFGLGFYIIMTRAEARGQNPQALFIRRLLGLGAIGLVHLVLIWTGDILTQYAVTGFALLAFFSVRQETLKKWIVGLALLSVIIFGLIYLALGLTELMPEAGYKAWIDQAATQAQETYSRGSAWDILLFRLTTELPSMPFNILIMVPNILFYFLIGFYVGRTGLFREPAKYLGAIRNWNRLGLLLGATFALLYALVELEILGVHPVIKRPVLGMATYLGAVFLATFYVTSIILIARRGWGARLLAPLAAAGRMALTNYLTQSLICVLIFYNYGLGLFGEMSVLQGMMLTLLIFLVQVIWSNWWMRHYDYGPMEWLWRRWTYGAWTPQRERR